MDHADSRPSMADVARLAGVSTQTVSRVVNGSARVHPQTRLDVEEAMTKLHYVPNGPARALRGGGTGTLGVVVHRLSGNAESRIVEAIAHAARAAGYTVTLAELEKPTCEQLEHAVCRLQQQLVDGMIVIRHEVTGPASRDFPIDVPHVVSDPVAIPGRPWVGVDQAGGVARAIRHLLDLGHETVHHLAGPSWSGPAVVRHRAWQTALEAAGRHVPAVLRGDWTAPSGRQAASRLLTRRRRGETVTAALASNDEMAAGLMAAVRESGLRVPEDISVIGFDDTPLAPYLTPPLTTVDQDFAQVGRLLVTSLLNQMQPGENVDDAARVVVPTSLVVRGSTAQPPGDGRAELAPVKRCAPTHQGS